MHAESVLTTLPETCGHSHAPMKLCRFGDGRLGVVEGSDIRDVTRGARRAARLRGIRSRATIYSSPTCPQCRARQTLLSGCAALPLSSVTLLSPVANPGKIVAAPVNYQKHLDEVRTRSAAAW